MRHSAYMQTGRVNDQIEIEGGGEIDRWIDLTGVSEITGLKPPTLRNAERRGDIIGYRILGRLRFKVADVIEFMERGREAPRRIPPAGLLESAARRKRSSRRRR